jgi:hypothetical protein
MLLGYLSILFTYKSCYLLSVLLKTKYKNNHENKTRLDSQIKLNGNVTIRNDLSGN